ncbi:GNAT family N-acetyltransferase [Kitasatospora fiedleri]|uniref:GNAT family N-acetyltransferase n=1 Tax=Kitasatospora fiedleri TaxID=2991545 RepID=UPI00249C44A8|nr:GNAT family protein [Kitasatospora fiedleri]
MSPESLIWLSDGTCGLGPLRSDLAEEYWRWEEDPSSLIGFGRPVPESLPSRAQGLQQQLAGRNIRFTVYDLTDPENPVPAGMTTLQPDTYTRAAEYILVIAPDARGKGLATSATRLTLDFGFHVSNLRSVWLKVLAPNKAAVRVYETAGFQHVGAMRQAGYWHGAVCDELIMDALAADFSGPSVFSSAS